MPLFWRYLLKEYFQVFFLSVLGLIGILLLTRVQEIARLACIYPDISQIGLFILLQIPYILSFVIPISALVSAILLFQRLSSTHELTAFRASGVGIRMLITPLALAAFLVAVIHFIVVAEITPRSRHDSHTLIQDLAMSRPFFLTKKSHHLQSQKSYIDMEIIASGKEAKQMIIGLHNPSYHRLTLVLAKEVAFNHSLMEAKNMAVIWTIKTAEEGYDHLMIENQETVCTPASAFLSFFQKAPNRTRLEYLPIRGVIQMLHSQLDNSIVKKAQSEIYRRFFFSIHTFALAMLGFSLGIDIQREKKSPKIGVVILFSTLTFFSFMAAKSLHATPHRALFFYILPSPLLLFVSYLGQKQIMRG